MRRTKQRRWLPNDARQTKVSYHADLERNFDDCARFFEMLPISLRQATETAIRERHHTEATIDEGDQPDDHKPDVFNLRIGRVRVYYTIETMAVVVRGYVCDLDREQCDDRDCSYYCSYICEPEWYPERFASYLARQLRPKANVEVPWMKRFLKKILDFAHLNAPQCKHFLMNRVAILTTKNSCACKQIVDVPRFLRSPDVQIVPSNREF